MHNHNNNKNNNVQCHTLFIFYMYLVYQLMYNFSNINKYTSCLAVGNNMR